MTKRVVRVPRNFAQMGQRQLEIYATELSKHFHEGLRLRSELESRNRQLELLLAQVVAAQEEERRRIASELHDGAAQLMLGVLYRVQIMSAVLNEGGNTDLLTELADIQSIVDASIRETRRVLVGLGPPNLEHLGLVGALRHELDRLSKDGASCTWKLTGKPVPLPISLETTIYRIVQEALNNVRNHAKATRVSLKVEFRENKVMVKLADNGKGFDVPRTLEGALAAGRLGLWGIRQRAQALGGELSIASAPESGTTILLTLTIPVRVPEKEAVIHL